MKMVSLIVAFSKEKFTEKMIAPEKKIDAYEMGLYGSSTGFLYSVTSNEHVGWLQSNQ